MIKSSITDGPSEKKLFFSLSEDTRRYEVEFKTDGYENLGVVINQLVRTDNPAVWGWSGTVSECGKEKPNRVGVYGLFDVRKRDGVLFAHSSLRYNDESTLTGRHPVELRIREDEQKRIISGPPKPHIRLYEEMLAAGSEPLVPLVLALTKPVRTHLHVIRIEWMGPRCFFEGVTLPTESGYEKHIIGYWDFESSDGYVAFEASPNSSVLEGLSL